MTMNANNEANTNETAEDFAKISMSEAFDGEAVYREKIEPLLADVYAICKEHGLPLYNAICISNDPGNAFKTVQSIHFNGPERTPTVLVIAQKAVAHLEGGGAGYILQQIDKVAALTNLLQLQNADGVN